jgi:hypothetical protein
VDKLATTIAPSNLPFVGNFHPEPPRQEPEPQVGQLGAWFKALMAFQYEGDMRLLHAMAATGADMPGVVFRHWLQSHPDAEGEPRGRYRLVLEKIPRRRGRRPALSNKQAAALYEEMRAAYDADGRRVKDAIIDEFAAREGIGARTLYKLWEVGEYADQLAQESPKKRSPEQQWGLARMMLRRDILSATNRGSNCCRK